MKRLIATLLLCLPATLAVAQELPPEIAKNGLKVAVVPNYPPMEFKDPATGQCRGISTTYKVTAVRALIPNGSAPSRRSRVALSNPASGASIGR